MRPLKPLFAEAIFLKARVASYALCGYKVTKVPMFIHAAAFWGCGLLPSYLLAYCFDMGIYGFWTALIASGIDMKYDNG